jgi:hypothetical protein
VPPGQTQISGNGQPVPDLEEQAPTEQPPVMLHVPLESKFGLGPSDPVVRRRIVEPAPAKRARRRRR